MGSWMVVSTTQTVRLRLRCGNISALLGISSSTSMGKMGSILGVLTQLNLSQVWLSLSWLRGGIHRMKWSLARGKCAVVSIAFQRRVLNFVTYAHGSVISLYAYRIKPQLMSAGFC